jgi:hypothetical protein
MEKCFASTRTTIVNYLFQDKYIFRVDVLWIESFEQILCGSSILVHTERYTALGERSRVGAVTKDIFYFTDVYSEVANDRTIQFVECRTHSFSFLEIRVVCGVNLL